MKRFITCMLLAFICAATFTASAQTASTCYTPTMVNAWATTHYGNTYFVYVAWQPAGQSRPWSYHVSACPQTANGNTNDNNCVQGDVSTITQPYGYADNYVVLKLKAGKRYTITVCNTTCPDQLCAPPFTFDMTNY